MLLEFGTTSVSGWLCIIAAINCCYHIQKPIARASPQPFTIIGSNSNNNSATDIVNIENGYPEQRSYKLEDFFWTGSGDGALEIPWQESIKSSTIYKTKTIMSTVYISISNENQSHAEPEHPSECAIDCETTPVQPDGDIQPTRTFENTTVTTPSTNINNSATDKHFWLLTVIRSEDDKDPVIAVLEKRLSKLYSVAFRRQQERHLGISKKREKRESSVKYPVENKPVNVCIHTLAKNEKTKEVELLYHVLVSGKPVAAVTAASDMKLVTDEEVANELGFPVRTKAEPFLKMDKPQSLARIRNTWLFIGVALATIFLLLLMVTIFTLCLNKRKNTMIPSRPVGLLNRQRIFEREANDGYNNAGFVQGHGDTMKTYQSGRRHHRKSPIRPRDTTSNETLSSRFQTGRPNSSSSTTSTSSELSDDSPYVIQPTKHHHHHHHHRHHHRSRKDHDPEQPVAINTALLQKQGTIIMDSESSSSPDKSGSEITLVKEMERSGKISPKSYLSIPSVKSFPRSNIPETLNKVLEPVSVMHLDMTDDVIPSSPIYRRPISGKPFTRHGSIGSEDPGVVGPVVWDLHCKRMQKETEEENVETHAKKMRRRFHELLDDTFSLFGNGRDSPSSPAGHAPSASVKPNEFRGHSAIVSRGSIAARPPRPKTSDPRRVAPSPGLEPPRGAWASTTPSPLTRPVSAGPFQPQVQIERILADGQLPGSDPAVPLIAAIKSELNKCSLPGSTTNLVE